MSQADQPADGDPPVGPPSSGEPGDGGGSSQIVPQPPTPAPAGQTSAPPTGLDYPSPKWCSADPNGSGGEWTAHWDPDPTGARGGNGHWDIGHPEFDSALGRKPLFRYYPHLDAWELACRYADSETRAVDGSGADGRARPIRKRWLPVDAAVARAHAMHMLGPAISGTCPLAAALAPVLARAVGGWSVLAYENTSRSRIDDSGAIQGGNLFQDLPDDDGTRELYYDGVYPLVILVRVLRTALWRGRCGLVWLPDDGTPDLLFRRNKWWEAGVIAADRNFSFAAFGPDALRQRRMVAAIDEAMGVDGLFICATTTDAAVAVPMRGDIVRWGGHDFQEFAAHFDEVYLGAYDGESYIRYRPPSYRAHTDSASQKRLGLAALPGTPGGPPEPGAPVTWRLANETEIGASVASIKKQAVRWNSALAAALLAGSQLEGGAWLTFNGTNTGIDYSGKPGAGVQPGWSVVCRIASRWLGAGANRVAAVDAAYWRDAEEDEQEPSGPGHRLVHAGADVYYMAGHEDEALFDVAAALAEVPTRDPRAFAVLSMLPAAPSPSGPTLDPGASALLAANTRVIIAEGAGQYVCWFHRDEPTPLDGPAKAWIGSR